MERFTLAGLLILMLCVPAVFAQKKKADPTRTVRGEVTAADNTAVVGAVVQLEDTKTKQVRSFITQQNGAYYFMGLSPDTDYELRAKFKDANSPTKTLSSFDTRKEAIINLKLNPPK